MHLSTPEVHARDALTLLDVHGHGGSPGSLDIHPEHFRQLLQLRLFALIKLPDFFCGVFGFVLLLNCICLALHCICEMDNSHIINLFWSQNLCKTPCEVLLPCEVTEVGRLSLFIEFFV